MSPGNIGFVTGLGFTAVACIVTVLLTPGLTASAVIGGLSGWLGFELGYHHIAGA